MGIINYKIIIPIYFLLYNYNKFHLFQNQILIFDSFDIIFIKLLNDLKRNKNQIFEKSIIKI